MISSLPKLQNKLLIYFSPHKGSVHFLPPGLYIRYSPKKCLASVSYITFSQTLYTYNLTRKFEQSILFVKYSIYFETLFLR